MFAVTALGLESECARELVALEMEDVRVEKGGVSFSGGLEELYLANLWLRSASRVLVRVGIFGCKDFPDLYRKALRLPWGRFIKPGTGVRIRATSHRSRLQHTGRIAETVQTSINRALGSVEGCKDAFSQMVLLRFEDNQCLVSIDSSGELLHRRGYRKMIGAAPLRETLASGVLMLLGWDGRSPLVDPMCGAGTFVIEGALMGMGRAPGIARTFAFMHWPRYRPGLWSVLQTSARARERDPEGALIGQDRDAGVLKAARDNAIAAGVDKVTEFREADLEKAAVPFGPGLVLCNPPYGERIGRDTGLVDLYHRLGNVYRSHYRGWTGAVLCPVGPLAKALGDGFDCIARLQNGGIEVGLYRVNL